MLAVNIGLWVYHLIPYDTSAKQGSCEASSTSQFEVPTEGTSPSTSSPQTTPAATKADSESQKTPVVTSETKTWTCRQPAPSSITTTAAITLGGFVVAEMLVVFGSFSFDAGKFSVSANVQPKAEVALTHETAQEADRLLETDE